jgi:putative transposase
MKRSKFTDEQILAIVKEGEAGRKVADLCRTHGITEQTYYRWKAKYGGMELSEMQGLKQLEVLWPNLVGSDSERSGFAHRCAPQKACPPFGCLHAARRSRSYS